MRSYLAQPGFPAAVLGTFLILELSLARILFTADDNLIYFAGKPLEAVCWVKQSWGVPCPACGGSRGFILTLHGRPREGWRLSPVGPLAAIGMLGWGLGLLAFSQLQRQSAAQAARVKRWLTAGALAYAAAGTLIWTTAWVAAVARARGG